MTISNKIKTARNEARITQRQLSAACDLSRNYIALIETGKKNPSIQSVRKIAAALDVKISYLLDDDIELSNMRENIVDKFGGKQKLVEYIDSIDDSIY